MIPPEMAKAIEESFAADREREKQRRVATGELDLELVGAPDDPTVDDPAFQAELASVGSALRDAAISYSQRAIAFDAADAHGYPLAEYTIRVLGPHAIDLVGGVITGWLAARAKRKARLKFGHVEAEASTPEEVEQLLRSALQFQRDLSRSDEGK